VRLYNKRLFLSEYSVLELSNRDCLSLVTSHSFDTFAKNYGEELQQATLAKKTMICKYGQHLWLAPFPSIGNFSQKLTEYSDRNNLALK